MSRIGIIKNLKKVNILYPLFQKRRLPLYLSKTTTVIWKWNESMNGTYSEYIRKIRILKSLNSSVYIYYCKLGTAIFV